MKQKVGNRVSYILLVVLLICQSCGFRLRSYDAADDPSQMKVERYDRLESRYVITGDFSALQQMNTEYPIETRTLVERILKIGDVSDHDINEKLLRFYQDSTLQAIVSDAESEYANLDDVNEALRRAFTNLKKWVPEMPIPRVYAQIGSLDQSIVVGDHAIGISLDKYMGAKYPIYAKFGYSNEQLESMGRNYIVPDCVNFYLLSLYPMKNYDSRTQAEKDLHMGKIMWVTNKAMEQKFFETDYVDIIGHYMRTHPSVTVQQLLDDDSYDKFEKAVAHKGK